MTIYTVVEHRDGRYLELEKMIGSLTPQGRKKGELRNEFTLIFDHVINRFPTVILDTWRTDGVIALMAPGLGPLARYQALKAGYFLIVCDNGQALTDGEPLVLDPEHRCWRTQNNAGGMLTTFEKGSQDMAAFLAAASEEKVLLECLADVVGFGLDPAVTRF